MIPAPRTHPEREGAQRCHHLHAPLLRQARPEVRAWEAGGGETLRQPLGLGAGAGKRKELPLGKEMRDRKH